MADFGQPVAQNVNPTGQGLQTLSGLLGIQQQQIGVKQAQQNLDTGAIQQQTAQAESQQAQQKNTELQALGRFTSKATRDPMYLNSDGSLNTQKFQQDAMSVAPTYGQAYIGQATTNANAAVETRKALLGLTNEQRKTAGGYLAAVAANPNASQDDLTSAAAQMQSVSDDPSYQKVVQRVLLHAPATSSLPDADASTAIRNYARTVAMATGANGTAQSDPNISMMQGPHGLQAVNTNPQSPGGIGQRGAPLPQGLSPTDQPSYRGEVAAATTHAAGGANIDIDRANQVSSSANAAPGAIQLSKEIDSLADQIGSGKISAALSSAASAAGIDPVTKARQVLNKDLGQLKTIASANSATDAKMGTVLSGYPEDTSATDTIHTAMDYIRGSFRQSLARGQNAESYAKAHPDMAGFQHSDNALSQTTDPLMHEYQSLPTGPQRQAFIQRNFASNPQGALEFVNRLKAAKHSGALE